MISRLKLRDFKIHSNLELRLGNMTILTGQNGMGKSSVMQSLLLLRQSCNPQVGITGLNLKGDLIPVKISNNGTVTKAKLSENWYDYDASVWANAVILEDNAGTYENGTVRFSYSYFTDEREILTACSALKSLIK